MSFFPCFAEKAPWPKLESWTEEDPLPGTLLLEREGDLSRWVVDSNNAFLDRQLDGIRELRKSNWERDREGAQSDEDFLRDKRERFAEILGLNWDTPNIGSPDFSEQHIELKDEWRFLSSGTGPLATLELGADCGPIRIHEIEWPVFDGVSGRGFLIEPDTFWTNAVAIPDTSQSPRELIWPFHGQDEMSQTPPYALQLALAGVRVVVPTRVRRFPNEHTLTEREWLHRQAFELGRTLIGYELHRLFSLLEGVPQSPEQERLKNQWHVIGWGDGGQLALYSSAAGNDLRRFQSCCVSGYFGNRDTLWEEPFDHHLFGLLSDFGDAEIAALAVTDTTPLAGERSGRSLLIETSRQPDFRYRTEEKTRRLELKAERSRERGKPGRTKISTSGEISRELERLLDCLEGLAKNTVFLSEAPEQPLTDATLIRFLSLMGREEVRAKDIDPHFLLNETLENRDEFDGGILRSELESGLFFDLSLNRHDSPIEFRDSSLLSEVARDLDADEIERHLQRALVTAAAQRKEYFSDLDTEDLASFEKTIEAYRDSFRTKVIGDFGIPLESAKPRTRPYKVGEKTVSYEVVLDVFDELVAYGVLTLPRDFDAESGTQLPVVVCQHGLEGTPHDLIGESKFKAYQAFATRLAERGYLTFAPQNGYKYFDHFRMQQFKAQVMGKTLFSLIVPQHEQITDWLASLPFVDERRIGFYGLSYGGKSAMRIPPLVDRYALSICSADFNDWVWKNVATDQESLRYSYANKGEYEIFEWNLGNTFNYAEMAALICPRPFMVERGHLDGVAPDERVALEFAKVRHLYSAKLGIGERCEIDWFVGPHAIHGVGTFDFLDRNLKRP
ncbi:MAG: hypothetical protein AAGC68_03280 [Verrucomicrobiota bacterium]